MEYKILKLSNRNSYGYVPKKYRNLPEGEYNEYSPVVDAEENVAANTNENWKLYGDQSTPEESGMAELERSTSNTTGVVPDMTDAEFADNVKAFESAPPTPAFENSKTWTDNGDNLVPDPHAELASDINNKYIKQTDTYRTYFMNDAEKVAEAKRLGKLTGLDPQALLANEAALKNARALERDYNKYIEVSGGDNPPDIGAYIAANHPELKNLNVVDGAIALANMKPIKKVSNIISGGMVGAELFAIQAETADINNKAFRGGTLTATDIDRLQWLSNRAKELRLQTPSVSEDLVTSVVAQTIEQMGGMGGDVLTGQAIGVAVGAGAYAITKNPALAREAYAATSKVGTMAAMFNRQVGSKYMEYRQLQDKQGAPLLTHEQAQGLAAIETAVETGIEFWNYNTIMGALSGGGKAKIAAIIAKNKGVKDAIMRSFAGIVAGGAKNWAEVMVGETGEEALQDVTDKLAYNYITQSLAPNNNYAPVGHRELLASAASAAIDAIPSVAGMTLAGGVASSYGAVRRFAEANSVKSQLSAAEISNAFTKKTLQELAEDAKTNELLKQHPDVYAKVVKEEAEAAGMPSVYVDTELLLAEEGGQEVFNQIAQLNGLTEEQAAEIVASKTDVIVPTEVYAQLAMPDKLSQKVLELVTTNPDIECSARAKETAKRMYADAQAIAEKDAAETEEVIATIVNNNFTDEKEKEVAAAALTLSPSNPAKGVAALSGALKKKYDEILAPVMAVLNEGWGQGVAHVKDEETGRYLAYSNNAGWYSEWYAEHKRQPTQEDIRSLAYDLATGSNPYGVTGLIYDQLGELTDEQRDTISKEWEANKAQLENIQSQMDAIKKIAGTLKNVAAIETSVTKGLSPEGYRVYRKVFDILNTGNAQTQVTARFAAVMLARHADQFAKEKQRQGVKGYTAETYLENRLDINPNAGVASNTNETAAQYKQINVLRDFDTAYEPVVLDDLADKIGAVGESTLDIQKVEEFIKGLAANGETVTTEDLLAVFNVQGVGDGVTEKHIVNAHSQKGRKHKKTREMRNRTLSNMQDVLAKAILIEIGPAEHKTYQNVQHSVPPTNSYRFVLPVKFKGHVYTMVVTAESFENQIKPTNNPVALYEVFVKKNNSVSTEKVVPNANGVGEYSPVSYTIKQMLENVKGLDNQRYVDEVTGELNISDKILIDHRATYNQYAGEQSATANLVALDTAKEMESSGATREDIYNKTGWLRGDDKKWRYYIPDKLDNINVDGVKAGDKTTLGAIYDNEELYAAYPWLKSFAVVFEAPNGNYEGGVGKNAIHLVVGQDKEKMQSVLVHEVQHLVQRKENFAKGGNPGAIGGLLDKWKEQARNEILDALETKEGTAGYERWKRAVALYNQYIDDNALRRAENKDSARLQTSEYIMSNLEEGFSDSEIKKIKDIATQYYAKEIEVSKYERALSKDGGEKDYLINAYFRLAGEIESRRSQTVAEAEAKVNRYRERIKALKEKGVTVSEETRKLKEQATQILKGSAEENKQLKEIADKIEALAETDKANEAEWARAKEEIKSLFKQQSAIDSKISDNFEKASAKIPQNELMLLNAEADLAYFTNELNQKLLEEVPDAILVFSEDQARSLSKEQTATYNQASAAAEVDAVRKKYEGTDKWLKAPNGEQSKLTEEQWLTVRTESFKNWFGDWENNPAEASKAVDENGEPIVVYHGSYETFDTFDRTKSRANTDIQGNFFSPDKREAQDYGGNVRAFYLNIRNPASQQVGYKALEKFEGQNEAGIKAREELVSQGYDGVNNDGEEYITFDANQTKSVDNKGTFSTTDGNVYNQGANQQPTINGQIAFARGKALISLFETADQSTFMHEMGHLFLSDLKDLASTAEAGAQVAKDWNTVKEWLGYTDEQTGFTVEQQEKFARGFEAYLRTGKAPTGALKTAFRKFKTWLTQIYKDFAQLGGKPSAEISKVMDRMIASQEEVDIAMKKAGVEKFANSHGLQLLDKTSQEMYQRWLAKVRSEAEEEVLQQAMEDIRAEEAALNEETLANIQKDVEKDLQQENIFKAEAVVAMMNGDTSLLANYGYTEESYKEELAKRGGSYENAVKIAVEEARKELENDSLSPEAIRAAAQEAVKNSEYAAMLQAAELIALNRQVAEHAKSIASSEDSKELKEVMANTRVLRDMAIGTAKQYHEIAINILKKMPIKQMMYLGIWARKAAQKQQAVMTAITHKDWTKAKEAKQQQLTYTSILTQASKVKTQLDKVLARIAKRNATLDKGNTRLPADERYLYEHLCWVLGLRRNDAVVPSTGRKTLTEIMRANFADFKTEADEYSEEQDVSAPAWIEELAQATEQKGYEHMTVDEVNEVVAYMDMLYKTGRDSDKLVAIKGVDGEELSVSEVAAEIAQTARQNINWTPAEDVTGLGTGNESALQGLKNYIGKAFAQLVKIETLLQRIDGYIGAVGREKRGIANRLIYEPVSKAASVQLTMQRQATDAIKKIFSVYSPAEMNDICDNRKYKFGTSVITKEQLICIALNMGTATNAQRMIDGYAMQQNENELDPLTLTTGKTKAIFEALSNLTAKDWEVVESIWRLLDSYWPEESRVEENTTGMTLGREEATPFTVYGKDGNVYNLSGGYYPIKFDPSLSSKAASDAATDVAKTSLPSNAIFGAGRSYTKARSKHKVNRQVYLSFNVIAMHLEQVVHNIAMRETVRDVNRIINNQSFKGAIEEVMGQEEYRIMKEWGRHIWQEEIHRDFWSKQMRYLRTHQTMAILGYRVSTSLMNVCNLPIMIGYAGGMNFINAYKDFMAAPIENFNFINALSPFMAERSETMDRDTRAVLAKQKNTVHAKTWDAVQSNAFKIISFTDNMFGYPLWYSEYKKALNKAIQEGRSNAAAQEEAVQAGDRAVRKVVGSGAVQDLAPIQKGSEIGKAFTMFYTFFNAIYNLGVGKIYAAKDMKEAALTTRMVPVMHGLLWFMLGPAVMETTIRGLMDTSGEDKDKKWWAKQLAQGTLENSVAYIPGLRDIGRAAIEYELGGFRSASKEYKVSGAFDGLQRAYQLFTTASDAADPKSNTDRIDVLRASGRAFNSMTGSPDMITDSLTTFLRYYQNNFDNAITDYLSATAFDRKLKKTRDSKGKKLKQRKVAPKKKK